MQKITLKTKAYILIFVIFVIASYLYITSPQRTQAKCPDDYATEKEQMTAMNKWTNKYYDNHPGATLSDWSIARYKFWVDNKCEKAIERYSKAKDGKADPKTMNFIKETIVNNN